MAAQVHVAGITLVKIATPADGSLESVGYTRNGPDVSERPFMIPVPGDENGGDSGPPIDIQWLGETARIRLEFTKYDSAVTDKLRKFVAGATLGTPATAGTLMFQDNKAHRLVLANTNNPLNFPRVVFNEPAEYNVGSRYTVLVLTAEAHKDASGVLFNTTVT